MAWARIVWACAAVCAVTACSKPPPAVEVSLSSASFATTGGNLFNCGSPAQAATETSVARGGLACDPGRAPDGSLATKPVTVTEIVGCGDGQGALVTITCAGTGDGDHVTGSVTLAITPSCSSDASAADPQTFVFQDVAPGATVTTPGALESCAVFDNVCSPSDTCAFNSFAADISVTNTSQ